MGETGSWVLQCGGRDSELLSGSSCHCHPRRSGRLCWIIRAATTAMFSLSLTSVCRWQGGSPHPHAIPAIPVKPGAQESLCPRASVAPGRPGWPGSPGAAPSGLHGRQVRTTPSATWTTQASRWAVFLLLGRRRLRGRNWEVRMDRRRERCERARTAGFPSNPCDSRLAGWPARSPARQAPQAGPGRPSICIPGCGADAKKASSGPEKKNLGGKKNPVKVGDQVPFP